MPFLDFLKFKKNYRTNVICFNCGSHSEITVPKGITIDSYVTSESCLCPTCGCNTLKRVIQSSVNSAHRTPVIKQVPQKQSMPQRQYAQIPPPNSNMAPKQLKPFQQQVLQRQRPKMQRSQPRPQQQQQRVQYPVNEPVYQEPEKQQEPNFGVGPKKINFWTGKEEQ